MTTPLGPIAISPGQSQAATFISSQPPAAAPIISSAHAAILAILVEAGGLAVVIFVAGTDDSMASLMLLFVAGIFLLFIVMHPAEVQSVIGKLTARGSQLGATP